MRRFVHVLALAAALALAVSACASDKDTGLPTAPTSAPAGGTTVTMPGTQLKFDPQTLNVKVGDTVTWEDDGGLPHTVTSEPNSPVKFDSNQLAAGTGTFKFTFDKAGEYPYYCKLHSSPGSRSGMIGTIVVAAA